MGNGAGKWDVLAGVGLGDDGETLSTEQLCGEGRAPSTERDSRSRGRHDGRCSPRAPRAEPRQQLGLAAGEAPALLLQSPGVPAATSAQDVPRPTRGCSGSGPQVTPLSPQHHTRYLPYYFPKWARLCGPWDGAFPDAAPSTPISECSFANETSQAVTHHCLQPGLAQLPAGGELGILGSSAKPPLVQGVADSPAQPGAGFNPWALQHQPPRTVTRRLLSTTGIPARASE